MWVVEDVGLVVLLVVDCMLIINPSILVAITIYALHLSTSSSSLR